MPASEYCILFAQAPVMFIYIFIYYFLQHEPGQIFKSEKNETSVAYSGLSTIKCQRGVANVACPPHLEQRQKKATTNIKQPCRLVKLLRN